MAKKSTLDLKKLYGGRFRVQLDESATIDGQSHEDRLYYVQLAGTRGHVFLQGPRTLGAFISRSSTNTWGRRLLAVPSAKVLQHGDHEFSVSFDQADLEAVAKILGLRKRRHIDAPSDAQLAARAAFAEKVRNQREQKPTDPEASNSGAT